MANFPNNYEYEYFFLYLFSSMSLFLKAHYIIHNYVIVHNTVYSTAFKSCPIITISVL